MAAQQDQLKCSLTLTGDSITQAVGGGSLYAYFLSTLIYLCLSIFIHAHYNHKNVFHFHPLTLCYLTYSCLGVWVCVQDISFKLKRSSSQVQRTAITSDAPWKLQQVQDAANHLQQAINHIDNVDENYKFR